MAQTGYILPAEADLIALIGDDFEAAIGFYQDLAQTQPFDLSGYTVVMEIDEAFTLTAGAGLTVNAPAGTVTARLSAAQTGTVTARHPPYSTSYRVKLTDGGGTVSFPLSGDFEFRIP